MIHCDFIIAICCNTSLFYFEFHYSKAYLVLVTLPVNFGSHSGELFHLDEPYFI